MTSSPGIDHGEHGRSDRFGRAGRHQHFGVGIELEVVEPALMFGNRKTQFRDADARRILIATGPDRIDRRLFDDIRTVDSGKPCPRLIDPVSSASADISAKIVVPSP